MRSEHSLECSSGQNVHKVQNIQSWILGQKSYTQNIMGFNPEIFSKSLALNV